MTYLSRPKTVSLITGGIPPDPVIPKTIQGDHTACLTTLKSAKAARLFAHTLSFTLMSVGDCVSHFPGLGFSESSFNKTKHSDTRLLSAAVGRPRSSPPARS